MPHDLRYALRSLARARGFTIVALLTLALGIGATTSIFSVVDAVLLRQRPFPDPSSVVLISRSAATGDPGAFSAADYLGYRRDARSFAHIAGFRQDVVDLAGGGARDDKHRESGQNQYCRWPTPP